MVKYSFNISILLIVLSILHNVTFAENNFPTPKIDYNPRKYVCYQTEDSLNIDGKLDEKAWKKADWTRKFVDIQGEIKSKPKYTTKVKMLWDKEYIYFGVFLEEPNIWATLKKRDAIVFKDNNFEIFIDPDFDTHNYYELEVNALNTIWDLFLTKPYRDDGVAISGWDIKGLKSSVYINGTLNNPEDRDKGWFVEIANPWKALAEGTDKPAPPEEGDQWRINFSRVEWPLKSKNGNYVKKSDPKTGKQLSANNWVWSPQGLVDMHYPEMWGIVQFTNSNINSNTKVEFKDKIPYRALSYLYDIYYRQKDFRNKNGTYTSSIKNFDNIDINLKNYQTPPELVTGLNYFQLKLINSNIDSKKITLNSEGKLRFHR